MRSFTESEKTVLRAQAAEESLHPIRPGVPGEQPFWNGHANRFIFAPAFEVEPLERAVSYRFTVGERSFEAPVPWAPLTPIWKDIPAGPHCLKIEALDDQGSVVLVYPKLYPFFRIAVFQGPYDEPAVSYEESARRQFELIFDACQPWKTPDTVFSEAARGEDGCYHLLVGRYPNKFLCETIAGMCAYAAHTPECADEALLIARNAADYMISISVPEGEPMAGCPPTYDYSGAYDIGSVAGAKPLLMLIYPVQAAQALLDLYEATREACYLDAVLRIVETLKRTQLPEGTWYLKVEQDTGEPVTSNRYVPIDAALLLERLADSHGMTQYVAMRDAAWEHIVEHNIKPMHMEGQFEDVEPRAKYENHTSNLPAHLAWYLFDHAEENPQYVAWAEELVHFAEDQFVTWEQPQIYKMNFVPCCAEQYVCGPVNFSVANQMAACTRAYEVTGNELYLAKAQTLANAMTHIQQQSNGWYPTWWVAGQDHARWINCVSLCAVLMAKCADRL